MSFLGEGRRRMQPPATPQNQNLLSPVTSFGTPTHRALAMAHTGQKTEAECECHLRMAGLALCQVSEPCSPTGMAL